MSVVGVIKLVIVNGLALYTCGLLAIKAAHNFARSSGAVRYRTHDGWRQRGWAWHAILLIGVVVIVATLLNEWIVDLGQATQWFASAGLLLIIIGYSAAYDADRRAAMKCSKH